ncbi:hypothetical protein [Streptomyces sp. NPDC026673]|uniref:hypothetical protein n=1 Tax=Streptomyces sp. NPDC026673 TaxID=3155724 RepID=UPI0033CD3E75
MNTGPEPEEEWELSVLLERVVPQPPAPGDRMARIRRRVRRRRRRRVAAAAAAATIGGVTAMVVAAALLRPEGAVTPRGQRVDPAASPSRSVPAPGPSLPEPTRSPGSGLAIVRLDGLYGLTLRVPDGWRSFETADPDSLVVGFVGSGPFRKRGDCPKEERGSYSVCAPVGSIAEGEVLISFRQVEGVGAENGDGRFLVKGVLPARAGCRVLGGDRELTAWRANPDPESVVGLTVSACFHRPTSAVVDAVMASLESARLESASLGSPSLVVPRGSRAPG